MRETTARMRELYANPVAGSDTVLGLGVVLVFVGVTIIGAVLVSRFF